MEQQKQTKQLSNIWEQPITIKLYGNVMRLPITDKRKIILSTLISTAEYLQGNEFIDYRGGGVVSMLL
jgi:hypothetical protein